MSATMRRVKPARAHGTCRWVVPLHETTPLMREGVIEIYNACAGHPHWQAYEVAEWSNSAGPVGYSLSYLERGSGERRAYDLPADLQGCDCAAGTFRDGTPCKHVRALSTLLRIAVEGVIAAPMVGAS